MMPRVASLEKTRRGIHEEEDDSKTVTDVEKDISKSVRRAWGVFGDLVVISIDSRKQCSRNGERKTLPRLLASCHRFPSLITTKSVNPPDCEERVIQPRAMRAQILFQNSGAVSEKCGTWDE
jgi:hypothetical protein